MDWHTVIMTLQQCAKENLTEAKAHADKGSIPLASPGLIVGGVLLGIADALREGLRSEREGKHARPGTEEHLF